MKYLVKFFVITLLLFVCTYSKADNTKILYIDLKILLNGSKAGKAAQDYLKKSTENNIEKYKKAEASLKEKEAELIAKKSILSKEEYKKMAESLRKDVQNYQKERNSSFQKIADQRAKSRSKLIEAIKPILDQYSQENDVSIIMNKKDVLYADSKLDITNIIVKLLNKKLPSLELK